MVIAVSRPLTREIVHNQEQQGVCARERIWSRQGVVEIQIPQGNYVQPKKARESPSILSLPPSTLIRHNQSGTHNTVSGDRLSRLIRSIRSGECRCRDKKNNKAVNFAVKCRSNGSNHGNIIIDHHHLWGRTMARRIGKKCEAQINEKWPNEKTRLVFFSSVLDLFMRPFQNSNSSLNIISII